MRFWTCWLALIIAVLPLFGCKTRSRSHPPRSKVSVPSTENPIVTPANDLSGKIARVNAGGRFVVIVFPIGQLPRLEQRMNVVRGGLKVGEVKITGPQLDDSVVADIVAGDVLQGDTVRSY